MKVYIHTPSPHPQPTPSHPHPTSPHPTHTSLSPHPYPTLTSPPSPSPHSQRHPTSPSPHPHPTLPHPPLTPTNFNEFHALVCAWEHEFHVLQVSVNNWSSCCYILHIVGGFKGVCVCVMCCAVLLERHRCSRLGFVCLVCMYLLHALRVALCSF